MPNITIDNIDYDLDTLSDEAKAQLQSLQFVDAELARLTAQSAVLQTARMAYSTALQQALPAALPSMGDTIKFKGDPGIRAKDHAPSDKPKHRGRRK